jgi:ribosomal protein L40E
VGPRIAPISETILHFPGRQTEAPTEQPVAAEDESPEVAARRAQLDLLGLGDPGEGPVDAARPAVLPYRSRGAAGGSGDLAARATKAGGSTFWEASAREVAGASANIGVQNCGQCGLSLSANARFCRRCGTRQAQSA